MKLLVIDSDRHLVEMLTGWLRTRGFDVLRAFTAAQARHVWLEQRPDLVLMEPALEDGDAAALSRELREQHDAFVIVLTTAQEVQEEVRCLEMGADAYVRKPVSPAQLLARIRAVSRRCRPTLELRAPSIITVGQLRIDTLHNEVRLAGRIAHLTPIESKLLYLLALNADEVCTPDLMVAYAWGYNGEASLIKSHIRHLREKIEPDPARPRYLVTVAGAGYSLVRQPQEAHV